MLIVPIKVITFAAAILGVWGHGVMETPAPRKTGPSHVALCGSAVSTVLESDITGPIENAMAKADADYHCNAYLCRGYQYADNTDNVKAVSVGDVLYFHIKLVAGHRPGYANVSVIDIATNKAIGPPLRTWDSWPNATAATPRDDIDFNVTIPATLSSPCDVAGKCVLQWYWWAIKNKQTFESCLDLVVQ